MANYVLYDGDCGFCSRWVPAWRKTLRRAGFEIATLQSPSLAGIVPIDRSAEDLDFTLLLDEGRRLAGADAYRYVMRRIWWAYPLFVLSVTPGLRRVFDRSYRTFARNRHRISRACALDGRADRPHRDDRSHRDR